MAGYAAQDRVDPRAQVAAFFKVGQFVENVLQKALGIHLAQHRGRLAHSDGSAAEGLDHEAEVGKVVSQIEKASGLSRRHFDDIGNEKRLRGDARFRVLRFEPFIDQPLVRRVLIGLP